jgi:cytoskeleton protein RodZ
MASEAAMGSPTASAPVSAGALLRTAREAQGLHIAALAASIKVAQRKLEALEADRHEELAGPTFTRALAQSVCRALRIDPQPVLDRLPAAAPVELGSPAGNINAAYRERGRRDASSLAINAQRGLLAAALLLLVAAAVTWLVPASFWRDWWPTSAGAGPQAQAPVLPAPVVVPAPSPALAPLPSLASAAASEPVPGPVVDSNPSASISAAAASAPTAAAAPPAALAGPPAVAVPPPVTTTSMAAAPAAALRLVSSAPAWIEVRDTNNRVLFSRTVQPGEPAEVDAAAPLKLVVGNAQSVQLRWRGQAVDLSASTRGTVARLELN